VKDLRWPLILALGAVALVRPLLRILEDQAVVPSWPAMPIVMTVAVSAVWILVVGSSTVSRPVLTLVGAGLVYAVFSIVLSGVLSPILTGELEGPLARPIAIIPMLLVNVAWGLITGALALFVQRARGFHPPMRGLN